MIANFLRAYLLFGIALLIHVGVSLVGMYSGSEIFGELYQPGVPEIILITVLAFVVSLVHDFGRTP